MPAQIPTVTQKRFDLVFPGENPDEADTYVVFRAATRAETEMYAEYTAKQTYTYPDEVGQPVTRTTEFNWPKQQRYQVALTMSECNLLGRDGNPLFRFRNAANGRRVIDMDPNEFAMAWGELPDDWAELFVKKMWVMNPQWSPSGE